MLCSSQVGPNTNKPAKGKTEGEQPFEVETEHCQITFGSSLPSTNWRLKQVLKKSSEVVRISGDLDRCGKVCQVGK